MIGWRRKAVLTIYLDTPCATSLASPATRPCGRSRPRRRSCSLRALHRSLLERRSRDPGMHVYHYAPYEPTAMKRLMGKYATRADELDTLLRGRSVCRSLQRGATGIAAGVEAIRSRNSNRCTARSEKWTCSARRVSFRAVESAIARKDYLALTNEMKNVVQGYNRDDCMSALELHQWLELLRLEAEKQRRDGQSAAARSARTLKSSEEA